jgi:hypothetical protein
MLLELVSYMCVSDGKELSGLLMMYPSVTLR